MRLRQSLLGVLVGLAVAAAGVAGCTSGDRPITCESMPPNGLVELGVGQSAYIDDWAMWVDPDLNGWLTSSVVLYKAPNENDAAIPTIKVERRADGFHASFPDTRRWSPKTEGRYLKCREKTYLKVVAMHYSDGKSSPKLRPEFILHSLTRMKVGEIAYTYPGAMRVDDKLHGWLEPHAVALAAPDLKRGWDVKVKRLASGYRIWLPDPPGWAWNREGDFLEDLEYLEVEKIYYGPGGKESSEELPKKFLEKPKPTKTRR